MNSTSPSELTLFFGRFHPLLVHLPIGFLVLLVAVEILSLLPGFRDLRRLNRVIAAFAVPAALSSVLCGWLLSQSGGYDASLLQWHKWTGFGVAAACVITFLLSLRGKLALYRLWLLATFGGMVAASHYGGSLTHGKDYLTRYAPPALRTWIGGSQSQPLAKSGPTNGAPATAKTLYMAAVGPVLDRYCVSCHGPEKSKAELRLDSIEGLRKGGESGSLLLSAKGPENPLLKRLRLPAGDEQRMPPEGKPQPSSQEIALLEWWIEAGGPADKTLQELNPPPHIQRLLQPSMLQAIGTPSLSAPQPAGPKSREEILPAAEKLAQEQGISITPLSPDEPWLQASAGLAGTNYGDTELAKLAALGPNLRWLDVGGTRVTDAGLAEVTKMKNLTRLHLERTALTDAGLESLSVLTDLQYLNLYGTKITDAGLAHLKPLRNLRRIYLWQTQVTPDAAKAFGEAVMDKPQMDRWQEEIASLKTKIRNQLVLVETGMPVSVSATNASPINTNCPVSGKPIDLAKTLKYEGKLVAFCCDNCKAAFEKDPKPHLAKLGFAVAAADKKESK